MLISTYKNKRWWYVSDVFRYWSFKSHKNNKLRWVLMNFYLFFIVCVCVCVCDCMVLSLHTVLYYFTLLFPYNWIHKTSEIVGVYQPRKDEYCRILYSCSTNSVTVSLEHNNKQQNLQSSDCSSADTAALCCCLWRWWTGLELTESSRCNYC